MVLVLLAANRVEPLQQIIINLIIYHAIELVRRMASHKVAYPARVRDKLPARTFANKF